MFFRVFLLFLFITPISCENSKFAGDTGQKKGANAEPVLDPNTSDPSKDDGGNTDSGDKDSLENDTDFGGKGDLDDKGDKGGGEDDLIFDDEEFIFKTCTGDNAVIKYGNTGDGICPDGSAAFLSDDGSTARVGCCALPSRAVFANGSKPEIRGNCGANEIAVGASGSGFYCRKINTKKFYLSEPRSVCYRGKGAQGGDDVSHCKDINDKLAAIIAKTGDVDGCTAYPYGAVMVSKNGKNCRDQKSVQIMNKKTDKPIKIFQ